MADSSPLSHQRKYDVFLSFRGEDTRKNFVDHLYTALTQQGIATFKDGDEKESEAASKAIEESRFAIVVFSKSYADSSWCLDELVKIMELNKKMGQPILPIFYYDINPLDLRRQGSVFGELFGRYEIEKVRAWTAALVEAANLSGRNLIDYRDEARCIEEIVELVSSTLNFNMTSFRQNLKGMQHDKLGVMTSTQENLIGIELPIREVKALLEVKAVKIAMKSPLASSSIPASRWTYDTYMSFTGNDACQVFAGQLYRALEQKGIYVFSDYQRLSRDESIASEHLKTIEESYIAVVIFSQGYAASSRCLDELVKIMYCNEGSGQIVLPVFYDVDPSDVRNQKGLFGEAFRQQKPEKIEVWRKALVKACSLAGWYLNHSPKSPESTIIKNIADVISRRLVRRPSLVDDNLIGMEPRMKNLMSLLEFESGSVHMLGICGMGGIGKTTLARALFEEVSSYFDGSCFIENIREVSRNCDLKYLQKEVLTKIFMEDNVHIKSVCEGASLIRTRLCNRKVLIVLDDVDCGSQLDALVGSYAWFGAGSRIICTTREKHLLVVYDAVQIYSVDALTDDESIQLLKSNAFKKDDHTKEYEDLLPQVVRYAAGLPLALKVLSSLLCGKSKDVWTSTLARLEVVPEKRIEDVLKISYDGLVSDLKNMFLDIACFFNGMEKDKVVEILDSIYGFADVGITLLKDKYLICIIEDHIQMHTLLQNMGRDIVRQEHPDEPGKRSRLWLAEDVSDVLMEKRGTEEITAIVVDNLHSLDAVDMIESFKGMKNLRLLQIHGCNKLRLPRGSSYLPDQLQWLTWQNYPLNFLPRSFNANNLVGLELVGSNLLKLWSGYKYSGSLRFLDLSHSRKLNRICDFTGLPNLEKLKLEYCTRLKKVDDSIGSLERLSFLSLRGCQGLKTLPQSVLQLKSLERIDLDGCFNLVSLPDLPKQLKYLPDLPHKTASPGANKSMVSSY